MVEPNGIDELSEREKEILRLVATGASNKEIAQQLVISPNTVKVHLRNIFAKIGVASRTEATVYAIQQGYVQVAGPTQLPTEADLASGSTDSARTGQAAPRSRIQRRLLAVLGGVSVLGLLAALAWRTITPAPTTVPAPTPMRWETRSPLPTARSRLAATAYDDQIYAIGGETSEGVTGQVERYDPASDTWAPLNAKPTAVADVSAVVIGGQIYVPGGRLASGQVTDVLEVFDPQRNDWRQQAPLPRPLSAYAVVAFEGRLLLFGGWDGRQFVSDAYAYAPDQDAWTALSLC